MVPISVPVIEGKSGKMVVMCDIKFNITLLQHRSTLLWSLMFNYADTMVAKFRPSAAVGLQHVRGFNINSVTVSPKSSASLRNTLFSCDAFKDQQYGKFSPNSYFSQFFFSHKNGRLLYIR